MNKSILLFILVLSSNASADAPDGSCAALLGASDSLFTEKPTTVNHLSSYLKALLDQGIVTEQDLIAFKDTLSLGIRTNPIAHPELDIARLLASEHIEALLDQNPNLESLVFDLNNILTIDQNKSAVREDIAVKISGMMLEVATANSEELLDLIDNYFSKPESVKDHLALKLAIERTQPNLRYRYADHVFSKAHWKGHPELLRFAIEQTPSHYMKTYAFSVFSKAYWSNHPELLQLAIEKTLPDDISLYATNVFSNINWLGHPECLRYAIQKTPTVYMPNYAMHVFSKPRWSNHPELLRIAIEKSYDRDMIFYSEHVFSKSFFSTHPELLRLAIERAPAEPLWYFFSHTFTRIFWSTHPELLQLAFEKTSNAVGNASRWSDDPHLNYLFKQDHWSNQTVLRSALKIINLNQRTRFLKEHMSPYPWEGTEQENLEEYLNKLYGRIDE